MVLKQTLQTAFCSDFYSLNNMQLHLSTSQKIKMCLLLRMLYPFLTLITWRFKKEKHEHFFQDQKTAALVISNWKSQCILPWYSKIKINEKGLSPRSLLNRNIEGNDLLCYKDIKQDLHSSFIEKRCNSLIYRFHSSFYQCSILWYELFWILFKALDFLSRRFF
jgi:hypothetical protein